MEKKWIQQVIIPLVVTILVILLSLPLAIKQHFDSQIFLTLIETSLIFVLPALPIIYGYITEDRFGSILMGAMPFLGLSIVILFKASYSPIFMSWLTTAAPFWLVLITIAGLEGYFASRRKISSFLVAICLYMLCILLFLFGIK